MPDLKTRLTLAPVDFEVPSGVALSQEAPPVNGYPTGEWGADEVLRGRQRWQLDPGLPAGNYCLMLEMVGPEGETSPPVELGEVAVAGRPHVVDPPAQMAAESGGRMGDFARLLGFDATPVPSAAADGSATITVLPASTLALTLYWQAEDASSVPYAVSVQLLDANGVLRAQHDQQPGGGAFPTTSWVQGEVLVDTYQLEMPADLAPGRYKLIVRMYDPATLATLTGVGADGSPAGEGLTLATVQVR